MADKVREWLRKRKRAGGMTWLWSHQKLRPSDGEMVENSVLHALDEFILPRWQDEVAAKVKPLSIRDWLYDLHDEGDYDWQTVSKIKMVMGQVFDHADTYELETCRNPFRTVRVPRSIGLGLT